MNSVIHSENHHAIVYDAARIPEPHLSFFDPEYWQGKDAVRGRASGRGSALFLDTEFGLAVLRPYLRGGWPAKISRDRYFFTGINRSRPFREFNILMQMKALDLPVPVPLAALVERGLISYRGVLLMAQIRGVETLGDFLGTAAADSDVWPDAGKCIRRFHQAGVNHADLNCRNILINRQERKVYLVDFDRCTMNADSEGGGKSNLARLKRSIVKMWPANAPVILEDCWQALMGGYHA